MGLKRQATPKGAPAQDGKKTLPSSALWFLLHRDVVQCRMATAVSHNPSHHTRRNLTVSAPDETWQEMIAAARGAADNAYCRYSNYPVGAAVRTRDRVRPVFVSPGHRTSLERAVALVLGCTDGTRVPKPTREADRLVRVNAIALRRQGLRATRE